MDGAYIPSKACYSADDFDGFRAAPLLLTGEDADPDLVESQDRLAWKMADAAYGESIKIAKEGVALFVALSTVMRMQQREGLNSVSYHTRRHDIPRLDAVEGVEPAVVAEACDRAVRGEGSPYQNHLARRAFGMLTIELANLTIFNEFRAQLETPMWNAISDLTNTDARPRSDQMYGLRILSFDRPPARNQHLGAVRIGMKRRVGRSADGATVKVRTTAVINTSPSSGFDQSIVRQLREINEADGPGVYERMAALPEFQQAVAHLIDNVAPTGAVIARNETVYEDARYCVAEVDK